MTQQQIIVAAGARVLAQKPDGAPARRRLPVLPEVPPHGSVWAADSFELRVSNLL